MESRCYQAYLNILGDELLPAMGCTEPIAVAYAAALARKTLGGIPQRVVIRASGNIVKNVKSVVVPHTGGLRGIPAAVAAGIVAGDADRELEVISDVTDAQVEQIAAYLKTAQFTVCESDSNCIFYIGVTACLDGHEAEVCIAGFHTNVILIRRDSDILLQTEYSEDGPKASDDYKLLNVADIIGFADRVDVADIREVIGRQIEYNTAIAEEGLRGNWGARIGQILLKSYGNSISTRARAMAAAGSDARMNGCELPVVINSGSGNQGLTASLPVIAYARELDVSEETLFRALIVSNLVTIHLKNGIGRLSAYCGVISAGCGAGAGITYLHGGRYDEISQTIVNALAINSGVVCDGAKASCAAKIASAVDAGLLGMRMEQFGSEFCGGDGLVDMCVESTIENVGRLAREGMRETDKTIIDIMIDAI